MSSLPIRTATVGASDRNEQPEPPDYANEHVFARNRLPARTYHLPPECVLLNGTWDFHYAPTPFHAPDPSAAALDARVLTPESPLSPTFDDQLNPPFDIETLQTRYNWQKIHVPGHWQLQGHGSPQYTNVKYPFPIDPPHVPTENPTGTYKRTFNVPPAWPALGTSLRLRFEGVDSAFHLWINGQQVGYHQGSRNTSEFDVTEFVHRERINELVVQVYQWSDGSYLEDQDQWWLSGVFRDVYLLALPLSRIEDFFVRTKLDDDYQNAVLEVELQGVLEDDAEVSIRLQDPTRDDVVLAEATISMRRDQGKITHTLDVRKPIAWSAEVPYLYNLELSLKKKSEKSISQVLNQRIGFRQVEIKQGILTVNGKPILLQGVNRHDHHPRFGRAVPFSYIRNDLLLMKRHNINALRCSHYPPDPRMLDLCDELGFWVIDEADLECHGFDEAIKEAYPKGKSESTDIVGGRPDKSTGFTRPEQYTSDNPKWKAAYIDRMAALVQRDKNHPSIIIWSLGNEAFYGSNHKAMYEYAKKVDPTRPVHYEGDAQALSTDMFSYMYPSVERLVKLATTEGVDDDGKFEKPMVLCEYGHAMGNGPGDLQSYQDAFRKYPRLMGGFIWEWANHGLWKEEASGKSYYGYGGDFNEIVHDGTFVMDGLCFSEHTPTPGLIEYKKVIEPVRTEVKDGHLLVHNLQSFASLDALSAMLEVKSLSDKSELIASGTHELHIGPGETEKIDLPASWLKWKGIGELWLNVSIRLNRAVNWADAGHEVAWGQHLLGVSKTRRSIPASMSSGRQLQAYTTQTTTTIGNERFSVRFDSVRGTIQSWTSEGSDLLIADPVTGSALLPGFWRAPTDNDRPHDDPYWKHFGLQMMTSRRDSLKIRNRDDGAAFEVHSELYLSPPVRDWGFNATLIYRITPDESVAVLCKLKPRGKVPKTVPRVGLDLRVNKFLVNAKYLGLGPGESYPDKMAAQRVDIYSSSVRELRTNYDVPQENGNRMGGRWVQFTDDDGVGLQASRTSDGEPGKEASQKDQSFAWYAGYHSPHTLDEARHPCDLVEEDVLLLRLDAATAGVGTGACGPAIPEYAQVNVNEMQFEFTLRRVVGWR